jgi:hypothetical protein
MKIVFRGRGMQPLVVVRADDRPILEETADGVVLVVWGRKGEYQVELTLDDCQRIACSIAKEATT